MVAALVGAAFGLAQEPKTSFEVVPTLRLRAAQRHLAKLGFTCKADEEDPPPPPDRAVNCGLQQPGAAFSARLIAEPKGYLLAMTVYSRRTAGGAYSAEEALALLKEAATIPYEGADPKTVTRWLEAELGRPLREMKDPGGHLPMEGAFLPAVPRSLEVAGVSFAIVGFPNSPGFELSVTGY
jgi:hypothetical protein